jgi:hypothetical protein
MKLPSYLVQSRHGVFYFRLTYLVGLIRREKRWSMHTKNPAEAKRLSIKLCALLSERSSSSTNLIDIDGVGVKVGHDQQQECNGMANDKSIPIGLITTVSLFGGRTVKMEVDQNDPKDVRAAQKLMKVVIAQDVKENGLWDQDYWPNQTQAIVQSALAPAQHAVPAFTFEQNHCSRSPEYSYWADCKSKQHVLTHPCQTSRNPKSNMQILR